MYTRMRSNVFVVALLALWWSAIAYSQDSEKEQTSMLDAQHQLQSHEIKANGKLQHVALGRLATSEHSDQNASTTTVMCSVVDCSPSCCTDLTNTFDAMKQGSIDSPQQLTSTTSNTAPTAKPNTNMQPQDSQVETAKQSDVTKSSVAAVESSVAAVESSVAHSNAAEASTSVAAEPEVVQKPSLPANMTQQDVLDIMENLEAKLYRSDLDRDTMSAVHGLVAVSRMVEAVPLNSKQVQQGATSSAAAPDLQTRHQQAARISELIGTGLDIAGKSLFQLGVLQATGVLPDQVPENSHGAVARLHQAAETGNTEALLSLSDRFHQGYDVAASCPMAVHFAKLAAQQVSSDAEKASRYAAWLPPVDLRERWMDSKYVSAEEADSGIDVVDMEEDSAQRGSTEARRRVAYRKLMGRGMAADAEAAYHNFMAGDAAGDPYAIFNLGYMYLGGIYVAQNYTRARMQFMRAAEMGLPAGWNGMGVMDWHGQGAAANLTAAFMAFEKGALAKHPDSSYNLGVMYYHGTGTEKNESSALEWYLKADAYGHWKASYTIALMYEAEGAAVEQNCTTAMRYFRKFFSERSRWSSDMSAAVRMLDAGDHWAALLSYLTVAEQGSAVAAANAAWLLQRGLGYAGDGHLDLAARMYERAAHGGHASSMVELGHMLMDAQRLNLSQRSNPVGGAEWYIKAARAGSVEGCFYAAWAFHLGLGIRRNISTATALYWEAVAAAGKQRSRAIPAMLALVMLQLDELLQPLAGQHAVSRLVQQVLLWLTVQQPQQQRQQMAGAWPGQDPLAAHPVQDFDYASMLSIVSSSRNSSGTVEGSQAMQEEDDSLRAGDVVLEAVMWCCNLVQQLDGETLLLATLIVGLAVVLLMRRSTLQRHA